MPCSRLIAFSTRNLWCTNSPEVSVRKTSEIEDAVSSYAMEMNRKLYDMLAGGRSDFLMEHIHFADDLTAAVDKLETML